MAEQTTRKQIREKVAAILKAKVSEFGGVSVPANGRVYENRMKALWEVELPAANIYTRNESAEIFNQGPREYKRTLNLLIDVVVKADDNVDDTVDELTRKIEKALFINETLDGVVSDTVLGDTEIELDVEGRNPIAVARMTWVVTYYTFAPGDGDIPELDDFQTAHSEMKPAGSSEETEAVVDDVVVQEPEEEEPEEEEPGDEEEEDESP